MNKEQVLTKEEFLILNRIKLSKFEVNPLDLGIAKMHMEISKEVGFVMQGAKTHHEFLYEYLSRVPSCLFGLITIDCSLKEQICSLVLTIYSKDGLSKDSIGLFSGSLEEIADYLSGPSILGICKGHIMWFDYMLRRK